MAQSTAFPGGRLGHNDFLFRDNGGLFKDRAFLLADLCLETMRQMTNTATTYHGAVVMPYSLSSLGQYKGAGAYWYKKRSGQVAGYGNWEGAPAPAHFNLRKVCDRGFRGGMMIWGAVPKEHIEYNENKRIVLTSKEHADYIVFLYNEFLRRVKSELGFVPIAAPGGGTQFEVMDSYEVRSGACGGVSLLNAMERSAYFQPFKDGYRFQAGALALANKAWNFVRQCEVDLADETDFNNPQLKKTG